jgi:hypothetical protein
MDFVRRSRTMVCSSRWGKSSLSAWTFCTGLEQWYVAHDGGRSSLCTWTLCIGLRKWYVAQDRKKVFSVHGVCTLV